jgi:hypothetical protein
MVWEKPSYFEPTDFWTGKRSNDSTQVQNQKSGNRKQICIDGNQIELVSIIFLFFRNNLPTSLRTYLLVSREAKRSHLGFGPEFKCVESQPRTESNWNPFFFFRIKTDRIAFLRFDPSIFGTNHEKKKRIIATPLHAAKSFYFWSIGPP